MPDTKDSEVLAYANAHTAILDLTTMGSMIDAARTIVSRIRVTLNNQDLLDYNNPEDKLYALANAVDHAISELLDGMMEEGIDCAPARTN